MNVANVHLLLNHWPIIGTLITLAVFVVSLATNNDDLKHTSLALFSLVALLAIPTYLSGPGAAEAIKESGVSAEMIDSHQGAALLAFIFMEITGVASLAGLMCFRRSAKNPWTSGPGRLNLAAVLVFALATSGLMAVAGNTGGNIRHAEILEGNNAQSSVGTTGAKLIEDTRYFVIDMSMWIWPILEDLHFIGLILLIGSVGLLNLRILGFLKRLPISPLHRFIPWGLAGFGINIVTGFLFYLGMPGFYVLNVVFQLKILAIVIAAGILLLFYCTAPSAHWRRSAREKMLPGRPSWLR
jgi:uncharacterized membrane protein